MNLTLELPEQLVERLQSKAQQSGRSVEELIEVLVGADDQRAAAFENVTQIKQRMSRKYGRPTDSVPLVREERDR